MATTLNHPQTSSRSFKTYYWIAALAVIAIGIIYSMSISNKILDRAGTGENSTELNYKNSERTVSDPKLPPQ